jgi:hypothetical protein
MKATTGLASGWILFAIVAVLVGWFSALPGQLSAQTNSCSGSQGQNGVYNPPCNKGNPGVVGSFAFIDASMFVSSPPPPSRNLCGVLNFVLQHVDKAPNYPNGAVIDARGLNSGNTSMSCTASPWAGLTNLLPSTILLPATTITIPSTWILPNNTRLIGEGYGTAGGTVILACTTQACPANFQTGSPMIQFGAASCGIGVPTCYTGISVENLMLNGNLVGGAGQNINGIENFTAQSSYVDHVTFFQILGIGLQVSAQNSGPYTNITFDTGSSALTTSSCASQSSPAMAGEGARAQSRLNQPFANTERTSNTKVCNTSWHDQGGDFTAKTLVELVGLEPTASSLRTRRSPN